LGLLGNLLAALLVGMLAVMLASCAAPEPTPIEDATSELRGSELTQRPQATPPEPEPAAPEEPASEETPAITETPSVSANAEALYAELGITQLFFDDLQHGDKSAPYQKYIVLHDTEGSGSPENVIYGWENNGNRIAAHFVVGKDGTVVQAVPLDQIGHHAGWGDTGHNSAFGVEDESRDDKIGTTFFSNAYLDYGMNSHSVGIELVHAGGEGDYPTAQLEALDKLIAYIDAYYGFQSSIIAHNDWALSNSDTSPEFEGYLNNYKSARSYKG
jgi:hypothetical protein